VSPAKLSVIGCGPKATVTGLIEQVAVPLAWVVAVQLWAPVPLPRVMVTGLLGSGAPLSASVRVDDRIAVLPWAKGCSADMEVIAVGRLIQITVTSLEVIVPAALVTEADRVSVPVVGLV
jgi:hypothetical protein